MGKLWQSTVLVVAGLGAIGAMKWACPAAFAQAAPPDVPLIAPSPQAQRDCIDLIEIRVRTAAGSYHSGSKATPRESSWTLRREYLTPEQGAKGQVYVEITAPWGTPFECVQVLSRTARPIAVP